MVDKDFSPIYDHILPSTRALLLSSVAADPASASDMAMPIVCPSWQKAGRYFRLSLSDPISAMICGEPLRVNTEGVSGQTPSNFFQNQQLFH